MSRHCRDDHGGYVMQEEARERFREVRDGVVRALSRLSLVLVLALMGALFVGGTPAQGDTAASPRPEPSSGGLLDHANPVGLVVLAVIVVGGIGVLLVGAFRPARDEAQHDLAEILRD